VIVGVPGELGAAPELESANYTVRLDPLAPEVSMAAPAAAKPAPRPRPRSARKPDEALASLPSMFAQSVAAASIPELADALPPLAPEPRLIEDDKPERLAKAEVATPVRALEPAPFPADALPARLSIKYSLTSPFADGRAEYAWRRDGDRYEISGSAEAVGFFTLFLEGQIQQESTGTVTAEGLKPERFVERKPQGPEEGLTFDWANGRMQFKRKDEVHPGTLSGNTVDWLSMIFQLAHAPPKGESVNLRVFTQRRLYEFSLKVLGLEELELPIGKVAALHLRHTGSNENETVDVWLGVNQHNLPVKLRYPVARNRFMVEQVATAISDR